MIREALFVLFLAVAPATAVTVADSTAPDPFCEGWEKGYASGYCYGYYGCFPPMPPACPFPEFMLDTYQDGYNRGFVRGREDRDGQ